MASQLPSLHAVPSGRGGAPPPGGSGGPPQKMLEFLRRQGVFWAISGQFGFLF